MENNLNEYDNRSGGNGGGNGGGGNGGSGNGGNGSDGNGPQKRQSFLFVLLASLALVLMISWFMRTMNSASNDEIPYSRFIEMLENGEVESVLIYDGQLTITPKRGEQDGYVAAQRLYTGAAEDADRLTERLTEAGVEFSREIPDNSGWFWSLLLTYGLPILVLCIGLNFVFKRMSGSGGPMGIGKSNAKLYDVQKETGITFKDVAGEDEAKESLVEVVDFLHNPAKYSKIGARLPKGALLVGPPGTGKTLLAKAVAGEAHVPFFSLAGSDFIELYVGVGASRVRKLFEEAEKHAPCIVFIDEIDAIGRSRDSKYGGGNEEREQTLNQLLSEMDGFDGKKGIIILAATNRPEILDKALLRPGRFDRRIIVDKPDLKGRVDILRVHAKDVLMDDSVDLEEIALATSGAVGSDLANMINEAAINAVKEGREFVAQKDLFNAVEVVLVGKEKKDRIMSKEERRIVSYHETGHALISALQKNSEPVQKITIVPRTMGALGYVMQVPEEEKYLNTQAELHDMLVGLLGGRAAEEIVFDTVTTGASNDIEKATNIARAMVTQYGMSKRFGLMGLETVESKYLDGRTAMNCSDVTAAAVDEEVMKILKESYKEAKKLLKENRELMDKLAEHLIEKETITGKEFMKIFRAEKGLPEPEEKPKEKNRAAIESARPEKQADGSTQNPAGGFSSGQAGQVTQMSSGQTGQSAPMPIDQTQNAAGQREQNMTGQTGSVAPTGQGGAWNAGTQADGTGGNAVGARQDSDVQANSPISGNMPDYEREQLLRNAWPQIRGLQDGVNMQNAADAANTGTMQQELSSGTGYVQQEPSGGMSAEYAPDNMNGSGEAEEGQEISAKVENEFAEALRNRQYARKEEQNGNNREQSDQK